MVPSGTVTNLETRVAQRRNAYFTFRLVDEAGSLMIFAYRIPE